MTDQDSRPQPIIAQLTPRVPGLLAGRPNTVEVLARIQGSAAAPAMSRRTPLNLALVLDRSGSMGGSPLFEAIRCAHAMIDRLRPDDHAALVVFDDTVDTLVARRGVDRRAGARGQRIARAAPERRSGQPRPVRTGCDSQPMRGTGQGFGDDLDVWPRAPLQ